MKKKVILSVLLFTFSALAIHVKAQSNESKASSKKAAEKWFNTLEWLGGLQLKPHKSVDAVEFVKQYRRNKIYWNKAFAFLKDNDLQKLANGKYTIDGDNVFATVTEDSTKGFDKTKWESHRKYIDLQYVIKGEEKIGVCPVAKATVTNAYNEKKDVANYTAEGKIYTAVPGTFFIFFPTDAHRPNITTGGNNVDKKIIIKIKVAK
jgi:biofilm protein TabA